MPECHRCFFTNTGKWAYKITHLWNYFFPILKCLLLQYMKYAPISLLTLFLIQSINYIIIISLLDMTIFLIFSNFTFHFAY